MKLKRSSRHPENGKIRRVYVCVACGWRASTVTIDRAAQSAGKVLSAREAAKIDRRSERIKTAYSSARPSNSHVSFRPDAIEDTAIIRRFTGQ